MMQTTDKYDPYDYRGEEPEHCPECGATVESDGRGWICPLCVTEGEIV